MNWVPRSGAASVEIKQEKKSFRGRDNSEEKVDVKAGNPCVPLLMGPGMEKALRKAKEQGA